jgi:RNA polymerase sigma factor (sigma-70 family)
MGLSNTELDVLVPKILDKDNDAFEIFYEEYKNIIKLHAKKWSPRLNRETYGLYDFEDLENEIWEMVLLKLPSYDSSKSAMTTWLYMICSQAPQRIKAYHQMPKRNPGERGILSLNTVFTLDGEGEELLSLISDPKSTFEKNVVYDCYIVEFVYRMKNFLDNLTEREQIIYLHSLKGMTLQESGNILGVTRERIRQLKEKIDNKVFNVVYNGTKCISMEKAYNYFNHLISCEDDDTICETYEYNLGTIKICREILSIVES